MSRLVLLTAVFLIAPAAFAQNARYTVNDIRFGFPAGPHSGDPEQDGTRSPLHKTGAWTPVRVSVTCLSPGDPAKPDPADLVVEAQDADDHRTNYATPLPAMQANETRILQSFLKPGSELPDVLATVVSRDRKRTYSDPEKPKHLLHGLDAARYLYLAVGTRLPGFKLPGVSEAAAKNQGALRLSEMAAVTVVNELPLLWYGYQGVDLAILGTSNTEFLNDLLNDKRSRAALVEWVRQGGRLLVSVGVNQSIVTQIDDFSQMLPVTFSETDRSPPGLTPGWTEIGASAPKPLEVAGSTRQAKWLAGMAVKPERAARVLLADRRTDANRPLIVQAPYGLGRVTVVGFDLETRPFTDWTEQGAIWQKLLQEAGPRYPVDGNANRQATNQFGRPQQNDDPLTVLHNNLEYFEEVPVVNFGWVALFILAYIIVVGPLDYFFLKKVVKRLELTWITFPLIVLTVSAIAYFTAYAIKGNDLRVNKVDFIDIDLGSRETFGSSYFSVFSPRIQNYTIGIEPAEGWNTGTTEVSPLVSWSGQAKSSRQSLFPRSYDYAPGATGLTNVPIQVWSTKGFVGQWRSAYTAEAAPFEADLRIPTRDARTLIGSVKNRLPADLTDVAVFYRDKVFRLGGLPAGSSRPLTQEEGSVQQWLDSSGAAYAGSPGRPGEPARVRTGLWPLLFQEQLDVAKNRVNSTSLRDLDQSWRLRGDQPDSAILLARVADRYESGDVVNRGPGNPTRVWLGALPQAGQTPPELRGTVRQDVYVRVYVPVKQPKR